jgi:DNA repair ATPase RecN
MKGDYKKLMDGAKDTDQKVDDARERVKKMEAAGDVYFAGREAAIKEIQSQELREKARQRLDENKKQYAGVKASLQDAGQSLQTLRSDLKNQITYLGSDLTPSAMTSLKPQAQKFNARGTEVLTKVDQSMGTANKYFDSMRPTKS